MTTVEVKDWIVLFVPIVCNGIFLFLFQFYLKRYFEKRDRVRSERVKTFQGLYTRTESAQTAMYALLHQKQDDNFTNLFNCVAEQIHQLKRFYDANEPQLEMFNANLQGIFSIWDMITTLMQDIVRNHNGRVPLEANLQISRDINRIYEILTTILQQCHQKMIDA